MVQLVKLFLRRLLKPEGGYTMDEREIFMAKQAMQSALMKGPVLLVLMFGAILVGFLF